MSEYICDECGSSDVLGPLYVCDACIEKEEQTLNSLRARIKELEQKLSECQKGIPIEKAKDSEKYNYIDKYGDWSMLVFDTDDGLFDTLRGAYINSPPKRLFPLPTAVKEDT